MKRKFKIAEEILPEILKGELLFGKMKARKEKTPKTPKERSSPAFMVLQNNPKCQGFQRLAKTDNKVLKNEVKKRYKELKGNLL